MNQDDASSGFPSHPERHGTPRPWGMFMDVSPMFRSVEKLMGASENNYFDGEKDDTVIEGI